MSHHFVFSYGSNSMVQLRGRIRNPNLVSIPAYADNWARIFCGQSGLWGDSGVASLAHLPSARTYGSLVSLTSDELSILDSYEDKYKRQPIQIMSINGETNTLEVKEAYTYLNQTPYWVVPPSEQYLTAIHVMLREQHGMEIAKEIPVCGILKESSSKLQVKTLYTWKHPGSHALSLPATFVEVNAKKLSPWVMPHKLNELQTSLARIGVTSAAQLAVLISRGNLTGMDIFTDEEISLLVQCFGIELQ